MEELEKIIYTLGLVEVHGVDNMSRLMGCIQALENLREELNNAGRDKGSAQHDDK